MGTFKLYNFLAVWQHCIKLLLNRERKIKGGDNFFIIFKNNICQNFLARNNNGRN